MIFSAPIREWSQGRAANGTPGRLSLRQRLSLRAVELTVIAL